MKVFTQTRIQHLSMRSNAVASNSPTCRRLATGNPTNKLPCRLQPRHVVRTFSIVEICVVSVCRRLLFLIPTKSHSLCTWIAGKHLAACGFWMCERSENSNFDFSIVARTSHITCINTFNRMNYKWSETQSTIWCMPAIWTYTKLVYHFTTADTGRLSPPWLFCIEWRYTLLLRNGNERNEKKENHYTCSVFCH